MAILCVIFFKRAFLGAIAYKSYKSYKSDGMWVTGGAARLCRSSAHTGSRYPAPLRLLQYRRLRT